MTFTYGFYNSVNNDRLYNATQFSEFFDGVVGDGVFQGIGSAFALTASGSTVIVGTGRAWFNQTWSYNDDELAIELPSASNVNHRIDTLVLEIDKRIESRENSIKFVLGTPSVSPVAPTLTPTADVYQYPLGNFYRARDLNTITQGNITRLVGSSRTPFATNILVNLETYDILAYKRSVVRGNHLGSVLTTAQKNAIKDGSFQGMYLGDYWTHSGVNWRIVDFDYYYGKQKNVAKPQSRITDHHVTIVPDSTLPLYALVRPFTSARSAANCGWDHSSVAKNRCVAVANASKPLFGNNGLLAHTVRWTTNLSQVRYAMNGIFRDSVASPMSEHMVIGSRNLGIPSTTPDNTQLALYKHGPRYVWMGQEQGLISKYTAFWLHNQYVLENWVCLHDWNGSDAHAPYESPAAHEIRPVFAITGK